MTRMCAAIIVACFCLAAAAGKADTIRIATFHTELQRDGPGLLLRDILRGAPDVEVVVRALVSVSPDIVALQGLDWDYENKAARALSNALKAQGLALDHIYAPPQNRGRASGADLDGDGQLGGPGDNHGYGTFTGQAAMALFSRFPIARDEAQDFTDMLWRDLPGAKLPTFPDGQPYPSVEAQAVQRLSSSGHWSVPVTLHDGSRLAVLTFHATPPVFDGPEDRNGLRNHDEIAFWTWFLNRPTSPDTPFVLAGNGNLDPDLSEGRREAIQNLLRHPALQEPSALAAVPTVDWRTNGGPGRLRVSYVLPSRNIMVKDAGVMWPDVSGEDPADVTRHAVTWVDITIAP